MVRVLAFLLLTHFEGWEAGGGVVEGVEVGEDQLEGGPLPGGYAADLLEATVGSQHLRHTNSVEIAGNIKMDLVVIFSSHSMYSVYYVGYSGFFILAPW